MISTNKIEWELHWFCRDDRLLAIVQCSTYRPDAVLMECVTLAVESAKQLYHYMHIRHHDGPIYAKVPVGAFKNRDFPDLVLGCQPRDLIYAGLCAIYIRPEWVVTKSSRGCACGTWKTGGIHSDYCAHAGYGCVGADYE